MFYSVCHRLQGQLLPGLRAGLGVEGLPQFPCSTLGFQLSRTPGSQRVLPASSCFFLVGALPLDSELALFWKHFGCPLHWAASTSGRLCNLAFGDKAFLARSDVRLWFICVGHERISCSSSNSSRSQLEMDAESWAHEVSRPTSRCRRFFSNHCWFLPVS